MKKRILSILIILICLLIYFNYGYPFFTKGSDGWSVGIGLRENPLDLNDIQDFIILTRDNTENGTKFIADPFVLYEKDSIYLFVERQPAVGNANIALFTGKSIFSMEYKGDVIDMDTHMSFPQVFRKNNEYYMIPETKRSNNVLLFKATKFPYEWAISDTLIKDVRFKDPSYYVHENTEFITTVDDNLDSYTYMRKFGEVEFRNISDDFPLKGNLVRPAGRIFEFQNDIYLPVQGSRYGYGSDVWLREIVVNENKIGFSSNKHHLLGPSENIIEFSHGMHHFDFTQYSESEYIVVVDGDSANNEVLFNWKRTLKYNFLDIRNKMFFEYAK